MTTALNMFESGSDKIMYERAINNHFFNLGPSVFYWAIIYSFSGSISIKYAGWELWEL